jgi:signal transduction histidine kinase
MGEAAQVCKERAAQAGVEIVLELDYAVGPFYFDPKNISRCVMNVVGNAIDATPPNAGRKVRLFTRTENDAATGRDWVVMGIADQGTGIPEEARDKVFDLMFSTKGSKGTGLGLALTRKIVEEHGGDITFETEMGVGTTFYIRLPKRLERPAPGSVS